MKSTASGSRQNGFSSPRVCLQGALLSLLVVALCVTQALAQSGRLDPTFQGLLFDDSQVAPQILPLPDGKLLVLSFNNFTGNATIAPGASNSLLRLNADGTVDPTFQITSVASGFTRRMALGPDGSIFLTGSFSTIQGVSRVNIVKLAPNGTVDQTFSSGFASADQLPALAVQADGKVIVGGSFTTVGGSSRKNVVRLNLDGSVDQSFNPGVGPNGSVSAISIQSGGGIFIAGNFSQFDSTARAGIAKLTAAGALDQTFNAGSGPSPTPTTLSIEALSDGSLLYAGGFESFSSQNRKGIVRLNASGGIDSSFGTPVGTSPFITEVRTQPDGKILLTGNFTLGSSQTRLGYVRLNANGTQDTSFAVGVTDGSCYSIAQDPFGNVVVAGIFNTVGGITRRKVARLTSSGSLDGSYNPNLRTTGLSVTALAVQPDDKVLVSGQFTAVGEVNRPGLARLNADGSLDATFNPGPLGPNTPVQAFAIQPDGKILIGGDFLFVGNVTRSGIARLNADGSVDFSFFVGTGLSASGQAAPLTVNSLAIQSDGKILVGGAFTDYNNIPARCLARLNTDGTFDSIFNTGTGVGTSSGFSIVYSVTTDNQGRVLAAGSFSSFNGQSANTLVRLSSTGTLDAAFNANVVTRLSSQGLSVKLDQDQKIILAGAMGLDGTSVQGLLRLNQDGTIDSSFTNALLSGVGYQTAILPNGKILIAGGFTTARNVSRNRLALFNGNGTLDQTFTPGASISSNSIFRNVLSLQSSGKAIFGGSFRTFNTAGVFPLIRLRTQNNASTPGQFRPSNGFVYLRNSNDTGFANAEFFYGQAGDIPVAGDWNGDGIETIGIYRNGMFFLRNSNTSGFADIQFPFGAPGDIPIVGDWDGDGIDTVGIVRGNTVFLRNSNTAGNADIQFAYGTSTDIFITGDWNGDGIDTIGAFRPSNGFVYLRNSNTTGNADLEFFYGQAGDKPIVGDWNADGIDTIGIVRGNQWFLRNSNSSGFADIQFFYGSDTDVPITGDWDGQ